MEIVSIQDELRKNPQLKQEDIDHLKEWVKGEEDLPEIPEIQLALFLCSCEYCMETTKNTIKCNFLWRMEQPDYFLNRNQNADPLLVHSMERVSFVILPKRTSQNEMILVSRIISKETKNFFFPTTIKSFFMHADMYSLQHGSCNGLIILYDCAPVTFAHARKVNLPSVKQLFFFLQEAISIKVSAIHFLNSHPIFDWLFSLFRPFIKQDLTSKLFFHKAGADTIFTHLPPALVPKLFNGEESSSLTTLHEKSKEMIRLFEPWFEEEEKALLQKMPSIDAKKRAEEYDELELPSSFKQLEFD